MKAKDIIVQDNPHAYKAQHNELLNLIKLTTLTMSGLKEEATELG